MRRYIRTKLDRSRLETFWKTFLGKITKGPEVKVSNYSQFSNVSKKRSFNQTHLRVEGQLGLETRVSLAQTKVFLGLRYKRILYPPKGVLKKRMI
jgi:hypothetical protein